MLAMPTAVTKKAIMILLFLLCAPIWLLIAKSTFATRLLEVHGRKVQRCWSGCRVS